MHFPDLNSPSVGAQPPMGSLQFGPLTIGPATPAGDAIGIEAALQGLAQAKRAEIPTEAADLEAAVKGLSANLAELAKALDPVLSPPTPEPVQGQSAVAPGPTAPLAQRLRTTRQLVEAQSRTVAALRRRLAI